MSSSVAISLGLSSSQRLSYHGERIRQRPSSSCLQYRLRPFSGCSHHGRTYTSIVPLLRHFEKVVPAPLGVEHTRRHAVTSFVLRLIASASLIFAISSRKIEVRRSDEPA